MDVEIQAQGIEIEPAWRELIDRCIARLAEQHADVIRVHVTLKHGRHHRHGLAEADIVLSGPGGPVRAAKPEETMTAAIHAAFDSLERELATRRGARRHYEKSPGPRAQGAVARLFPDRSYGFIRVDDGEEVFFHRNSLHELDFAALAVGLPVELEIEAGEKGRQASRVFPVGERAAT